MEDKVYYMFNKPKGCITARKDSVHPTVMEYFDESEPENLHPVGRLDKDTEGLLIMTNDGKFNQMLMNPEYHVSKTYYFHAMGNLNENDIKILENGIMLRGEDKLTKPAKLRVDRKGHIDEIRDLIKNTKFEKAGRNPRNTEIISGYITISEGKKHQVKRMLKAAACYVVYLKRISIGNLSLDENLQLGEHRTLSEKEIKELTINV